MKPEFLHIAYFNNILYFWWFFNWIIIVWLEVHLYLLTHLLSNILYIFLATFLDIYSIVSQIMFTSRLMTINECNFVACLNCSCLCSGWDVVPPSIEWDSVLQCSHHDPTTRVRPGRDRPFNWQQDIIYGQPIRKVFDYSYYIPNYQ